jgi:hypothetical protein
MDLRIKAQDVGMAQDRVHTARLAQVFLRRSIYSRLHPGRDKPAAAVYVAAQIAKGPSP